MHKDANILKKLPSIPSKLTTISVVIPTHNRERTIGYCLDSVLTQSFQPLEVLVVDDCSTDNTLEILWNYPDRRVRCIALDKKLGAQAARNTGIREAKGKWIAFQDSDDEWLSDKLQNQIDALTKVNFNPMTVVHTDCYRYDHQTGDKTIWELPLIQGPVVFSLLLTSPGPLFPSILTSKAALEKIGYLDESVPSFQEWDTSIRLARECNFIHIRKPLFTYHLHRGDTISKNREREIDGYQHIVDTFRNDIIMICGLKAFDSHLVGNALKAMRWGYYAVAGKILTKTIGRSVRVNFLKWIVRQETKLWFYQILFHIIFIIYDISGIIVGRLYKKK